MKVQMKVCSLFLLRKTLDLSLLLLQLLSKQIGISGHIHRLVAGSMAGKVVVATDKTFHLVPAGIFYNNPASMLQPTTVVQWQ